MNTNKTFRPDIQALRALAVMLVLVFHLWPEALPAGYIGVDIFFVISGFLITGVLFRQYDNAGRIGYLRFYLHRFRRLMPAASVVILVTVMLSFVLEPAYRHRDNAVEAVASALYFQNWVLAWRATDYLAAEESLGPLMHYWSLSVEEQFYLLWPGAMMLGIALSRGLGMPARRAALLVIAGISGLSLAAAVWYANQELPQGYFVTHTRLFELGIGAMLALSRVPPVTGKPALLLYGIGLVVIVLCAFLIPREMAFPGVIALVPTLACALLIHCGTNLERGVPGGLLGLKPIQAIGDASYSIYLWHWPLIYFLTLQRAGGEPIGLLPGLVLLLLSVFAGMASKYWIEDRYRAGHASGRKVDDRAAIGQTAGAFGLSIALGVALYVYASSAVEEWGDALAGRDHPGAMALTGIGYAPSAAAFIPPLVQVKQDLPEVYHNGCHIGLDETVAKICVLRESAADRPLVVLVGDSHAANWIPMVEAAARERDWRFASATASGCSLTYRNASGGSSKRDDRCIAWTGDVMRQLQALAPDVIIAARSRKRTDYQSQDADAWVPGLEGTLEAVLSDLTGMTRRVLVIPDTPRLQSDPLACLSGTDGCSLDTDERWDRPDVLLAVARDANPVTVLDLTDTVCPAGECRALIGNVVVWRDLHHLTATYSRSIGPIFLERFESLLVQRP